MGEHDVDVLTGTSPSDKPLSTAGALGSRQCTGGIQRKTYLIEGK